jgi:hypothetical protein
MVVAAALANGVKPYTIQRRRAVLVFSDPELDGMRIEARLDVDIGTFLDLQELAGVGASNTNPESLRAAFTMFGDDILSSWNLQDEDGTVLTADAAGFLALPPSLGSAILGSWSEAVTSSGEASASE